MGVAHYQWTNSQVLHSRHKTHLPRYRSPNLFSRSTSNTEWQGHWGRSHFELEPRYVVLRRLTDFERTSYRGCPFLQSSIILSKLILPSAHPSLQSFSSLFPALYQQSFDFCIANQHSAVFNFGGGQQNKLLRWQQANRMDFGAQHRHEQCLPVHSHVPHFSFSAEQCHPAPGGTPASSFYSWLAAPKFFPIFVVFVSEFF